MDEERGEPIRGLPELLPAGERILWQGAPSWRDLAKRAFHIRPIAAYCLALVAWRVGSDIAAGLGGLAIALAGLKVAGMAALGIAIPALLAYLFARSTVYTITNRRVVMRFGVAIPLTLNLPFRTIATAGSRIGRDGTGDIALRLMAGPDRIAYVHLWPHARPWRVKNPEPSLRSVPDVARVAEILAAAAREETQSPAEPARVGPAEPAATSRNERPHGLAGAAA